jgi:hypothetical protein
MSQRLAADAALYECVTEILRLDPEFQARCPGGLHHLRIDAGAPLPATAWGIKGGPKDRNFGIVASQLLIFWFKVNTDGKGYAGEAARARITHHFDGTERSNWERIKPAMESYLRKRGWHLQGCYEETPITASIEPLGSDMTTFRTAVGGIYHAKMQPIPAE